MRDDRPDLDRPRIEPVVVRERQVDLEPGRRGDGPQVDHDGVVAGAHLEPLRSGVDGPCLHVALPAVLRHGKGQQARNGPAVVVAQVERYGGPLARDEIVLALRRRECNVFRVRLGRPRRPGRPCPDRERARREGERGAAAAREPPPSRPLRGARAHCITLPLPYRTYICTPNTARAAANSHLLTSVSSTSRSISPPISAYISLRVRASTDLK